MIFKTYCIFCLKIFFTLANSVDPDVMTHVAVLRVFTVCISTCLNRGFRAYTWLSGC